MLREEIAGRSSGKTSREDAVGKRCGKTLQEEVETTHNKNINV
jgi:hypothetical protein